MKFAYFKVTSVVILSLFCSYFLASSFLLSLSRTILPYLIRKLLIFLFWLVIYFSSIGIQISAFLLRLNYPLPTSIPSIFYVFVSLFQRPFGSLFS